MIEVLFGRSEMTYEDYHELQNRIEEIRKNKDPKVRNSRLDNVANDIEETFFPSRRRDQMLHGIECLKGEANA